MRKRGSEPLRCFGADLQEPNRGAHEGGGDGDADLPEQGGGQRAEEGPGAVLLGANNPRVAMVSRHKALGQKQARRTTPLVGKTPGRDGGVDMLARSLGLRTHKLRAPTNLEEPKWVHAALQHASPLSRTRRACHLEDNDSNVRPLVLTSLCAEEREVSPKGARSQQSAEGWHSLLEDSLVGAICTLDSNPKP